MHNERTRCDYGACVGSFAAARRLHPSGTRGLSMFRTWLGGVGAVVYIYVCCVLLGLVVVKERNNAFYGTTSFFLPSSPAFAQF